MAADYTGDPRQASSLPYTKAAGFVGTDESERQDE